MEQDIDFSTDASGKNTAGGVPKNFRQQADMEAFYRFVHENDLRDEALRILDKVREQRAVHRSARRPKI